MRDSLFKYLNTAAIFILGLTSSVLVYGTQLAYTAVRFGMEAAMNGWSGSWPWNMAAGIGFIAALVYIVWYAHRQGKKDEAKEKRRNEILFSGINQSVKNGIKEAITELIADGVLQNGKPKPTDTTTK